MQDPINNAIRCSWFKPHLSTCALFGLIGLALSAIMVPGLNTQYSWSVVNYWEYGWPAVHMTQVPEGSRGHRISEPGEIVWAASHAGVGKRRFWSDWSNWNYTLEKGLRHWRPKGLAINIGVMLGIGLVVCIPFEMRRRKRKSLFQVSILDCLFLIVIVALPLGYWQMILSRANSNKSLLAELGERESVICFVSTKPPIWLERIGDMPTEWFVQAKQSQHASDDDVFIDSLTLNFPGRIQDVDKTAECILRTGADSVGFESFDESSLRLLKKARHSKIEYLKLHTKPANQNVKSGRDVFGTLLTHRKLEGIWLMSVTLTEMDVSCQFPNLKSLTLDRLEPSDIDESGYEWLLNQPKLERLMLPFSPDQLVSRKPRFQIAQSNGSKIYWEGAKSRKPN